MSGTASICKHDCLCNQMNSDKETIASDISAAEDNNDSNDFERNTNKKKTNVLKKHSVRNGHMMVLCSISICRFDCFAMIVYL